MTADERERLVAKIIAAINAASRVDYQENAWIVDSTKDGIHQSKVITGSTITLTLEVPKNEEFWLKEL